jgi:repressor LexA
MCKSWFDSDLPLVLTVYFLWCSNHIMDMAELQRRREALGMSREELAQALKTTAVSIWRWENGERSIPAHLSLALESVERNHGKVVVKKKGGK